MLPLACRTSLTSSRVEAEHTRPEDWRIQSRSIVTEKCAWQLLDSIEEEHTVPCRWQLGVELLSQPSTHCSLSPSSCFPFSVAATLLLFPPSVAGEKCMSWPEATTTSCVGLNPAKGPKESSVSQSESQRGSGPALR